MTKTLLRLPVDDIVIDEDLDFRTTGEDVSELAASIQAFGLMQPNTVAPATGDGKHHIVAGRRRLRACRELGLTEIDAIVDESLSDERAAMIGQIIENLQREDVGVMDEARAFAKLGDYGMKQKDVAAAVGVSSSHVSGRLALLKLPPKIADRVAEGKLPVQTATKLARAPKAVRDQLAEKPTVTEYEIDSLIRQVEQAGARREFIRLVHNGTSPDIPVGGLPDLDQYAHTPVDEMAQAIGLTDEDKPKSHEWDITDRIHRSAFDTDEEFLAAVNATKGKGFFVRGSGNTGQVVVLGSANLDKERKARAEEEERRVQERHAQALRRAQAHEDALAPLIASPDKAKVLAFLLQRELEDCLGRWDLERHVDDWCGRLDLAIPEGATSDEVVGLLRAQAAKSATELIRVVLATTEDINLLGHLGYYDAYPMEFVSVWAQRALLRDGLITEDRLTDEARAEIERERAEAEAAEAAAAAVEEMTDEEYDEALEAEVERRVDEHLATLDEPVEDDELAAITAEFRGQVQAEWDTGTPNIAEPVDVDSDDEPF